MERQLFVLMILLLFAFLNAVTINVPANQPTIQAGIDAAINGDMVLVQAGTYYENINYNGKIITVASLYFTTQDSAYISTTIINGNQNGSVIVFASGENSYAILSGFTITNGNSENGGGIYLEDTDPSLENLIISENVAIYGGGIHCYNNANPDLDKITITGNAAEMWGGGLYCYDDSDPHLTNVDITNNTAESGGGIFCVDFSRPLLMHVTIMGNIAEGGGGIYCCSNSGQNMCDVTITGNSANMGGGIMCMNNCSLLFHDSHRSDIYLNSVNNRGNGSDIYTDTEIDVIVDKFTVMNPTEYHTYPLELFTFSILQGVQGQVNADLYVSPDGDNENSGLTMEEPLKTIQYAGSIMFSDSLNQHTINLLAGTYSPSINGEYFPVSVPEYVTLQGCCETEVIIDAEDMASVMMIDHTENVKISDLTITHGNTSHGGGIYCTYCDPILENVTITENVATAHGGGIYFIHSQAVLENVKIIDNTANMGGTIYSFLSQQELINVTIAGNTANTGGAICCIDGEVLLKGVTITDNFGYLCGGIFCNHSDLTVINSIFWDNESDDIYFLDYDSPNTLTIAYTDIEGGIEGIETNNNGTVNWLQGNIDIDPLFEEDNGDYYLTDESPCIDAGIAYFMYEDEVLIDIEEDKYYGVAPDMGANESYFISEEPDEIEPVNINMTIYPNPFNPVTNIWFELAAVADVEIEVYNVKGQFVVKLADTEFEAGKHQVVWNAEDQGSGIFFVKYQAGTKSELKKIILLK